MFAIGRQARFTEPFRLGILRITRHPKPGFRFLWPVTSGREAKVVSKRVEAARRQLVTTLDLFECAQECLQRWRAAVHVQDDAGRRKLAAERLSQDISQRGTGRNHSFVA